MSACRVAVLAGVALVSGSAMAGPGGNGAHAGGRRVGFAVLSGSESDSGSAVDAARAECARNGLAPVAAGELRDALEAPRPEEEEKEAGDSLARARRQLGAARDAYTKFEYDRALIELVEVDRLLLHGEPTPPLVELMVERHLLAGLVHEGRRHPADARRSFRAVHHLDPDRRELDPGAYPPNVVTLFAQAGRDHGRGALRIATQPSGARLFVDGQPAGRAPLDMRVRSGRHWVVASAPGHRPKGAMVDVAPGQPALRSLALDGESPAERAAELRRSLRADDTRGHRAGAAALSRAAGLDLVVLVRARGGRVEGAVFDSQRGLLSPWLAMPSQQFSRQLTGGATATVAGARDPATAGGAAALAASAPDADRDRTWYSTWWGRTLLIAGGVAVGGAVILLVSDGDDPGYEVGGFCFAGDQC